MKKRKSKFKQLQLPLMDGEALRDAGIQLVLQHNQQWKAEFEAMVLSLIREHGSYTSEEVTKRIGMPPGHSNAVGAAVRAVAITHRLYKASIENAKNPVSHAATIFRWKPIPT